MIALLKELSQNQSAPTILPYNDEANRQAIDEIKVLYDKFSRIKAEVSKTEDISVKALAYILKVQIKRQKRVILAYHMDRLMKLMRKMTDSNDFSQASLAHLSNAETKFYHLHADNLVRYKASLGPQINLFGPISPPKDFFIQVRVEQDCGIIQTEHGKISLNRGTLHFLKRSDVEHLIIKANPCHRRQMSGGFFPESDYQNTNSPAKGRGGSNAQGLRACTIKQLQESDINSEGRLQVDGQEVSQFHLVCCVRIIKEISTGTDYMIEDGTSSINARCWPDKNVGPVREGDWIHLYGTLKALGPSKSVTVLSMRKITDFNEVTFHFLEAMTAYKIAVDPSFLKSGNDSAKQSKLASNTNNSNSYEDQSLTPLQRVVFSYYRDCQDELGVNINSIVNSLRGRYSESDVKNAVSGLLSDGHIYLTIDSDHAKNLSA